MLNSSQYKDIIIGQGIRTLPGWKMPVHLFLVEGLLIDCGPEIMKGPIRKFLQDKHIAQVALTHLHEDHSGMAAWMQRHHHVPVYLHEKVIPEARQKGKYPLYRHITWGKRPAFDPLPMPNRLVTDKYSFDVIDAPGHMRYHHVFHEKNQGWLFSGDLYLGTKPVGACFDDNMLDTIASLKAILTLDFDTIFCAHSGVVENGKAMFQKKLDYLLGIQTKVRALRQQGLDNHAIDKRLYPHKLPVTTFTRGEWSSYHLVNTI
ncbi:MAG TPA: MBL fold metallo-hydrolase [Syntrophomonas sp.]|nr:MBL fold metallo-hydrolase [Syntrophomonas sp.]HRW12226.1 MBL fold metallo-hydrolase [Syntrophomonas sp.]